VSTLSSGHFRLSVARMKIDSMEKEALKMLKLQFKYDISPVDL
jgi:hypothetical protein